MLDSTPQKTVTFELDGKEVTVSEGTTIWQAAQAEGQVIPHLCHKPEPGYRSDGNCRAGWNCRCSWRCWITRVRFNLGSNIWSQCRWST